MRYFAIILGIVSCIPLFMLRKAFETNVRYHDLPLSNYKEEKHFRLFFISDIHRRNISESLVKKVGSDFQAVIIGGDLAESGVPLARIEENIKQLAKIGPLYFVWGNNDREVGEQPIRKMIENVGGKLLENEAVCINTGKQKIWLVGIDDVSSGRADIAKSFKDVPADDSVIFVSHTPFVFNKVKRRFPSNVYLAGHTHGGQIRFGKWGYYEKGALQSKREEFTLISNGYGTTFVPLRLGAPAECHVLSMMKKSPTNIQ